MKTIKKAITLSLGLVMMGAASFAQSLADAKKAIDAEQYQKASSMLKTLVSSQAKEGENYYYLGEVYLRTEEVDSAKAVFNNGITADPKFALNYVGLGHADLIANNASGAKANFDKALSFGAKDYMTYLAIGKAYLNQKTPDFTSAFPNLTKADELDSKDKDPETFVALGDYYALQKKNSDAYNSYLKATDIVPNLYRVNVQVGKMYKEALALPEAEEQLKKATTGDPNYGPAYRELAELYSQWSYADPKNGPAKRALALESYRKFLDLTDKSFESRYRYAQFLLYAEDYATLDKELQTLKAEPSNPKSFIVTRLKGYTAVETKNYPLGVQYLNEVFARTQDASRIVGSDYLYLGRALQGAGNDSLALINVMKGVELDTTKAEELAAIGQKLYAAKKYDKAAEAYRKVISLNAKNPNMAMNNYYLGTSDYFAYAALVRENKNPDKKILVEADSAYSRLLKLAPDYDIAVLYKARIAKLMDTDPPTGLAVPAYEKYVKMVTVDKPEKATTPAGIRGLVESYNWLGAFAAATDKDKAKEYFTKTLAIDPANAIATDNLKFLNAPAAPAKKAPIK